MSANIVPNLGDSGLVPPQGLSKAEQLVQNVFAKTAQVVVGSRFGFLPGDESLMRSGKKLNKWFNLELEELDIVKEDCRPWKQHSFSSSPAPPLIIETFLDISRLPPTSKLLLRNKANQRYERIGNDQLADISDGSPSRKTSILLESWQMTLSCTTSPIKTELPIMYKKFIAFFRHLYGYVRLLPSYKLHKKLAKEVGHSRCRISYRISNTRQSFPHEAGLDQIHLNGDLSQGLKEYNFGTMETPFGLSNLHVMYRTACDFTFEMDYSGLSDKMVDFDDAYFRTRVIPTPLRRNFSSQHFDDFSSRRVPIRKSSQASLNSERSSDGPPRSFTSPSTTDFRPASVKAQDATLFSHRSSYASGSLPSPSYMAFTPPSVPSSFKFESTAPLFKDTPPFCLTNAVGDFSVKDIVNPDASPPFAIVGSSQTSHALVRHPSVPKSQSITIRPSGIAPPSSGTPPQSHLLFSHRASSLVPKSFSFKQTTFWESNRKDRDCEIIDDSLNNSIGKTPLSMALERFRQLGDLNDSFVASLSTQQRGSALRGSGSLYHGGGGDDEELLFNMSEIDMD